MTVAELQAELTHAQPSAEIFVEAERDDETITVGVADLFHVTEVDGSAVVLRLAET